MGLFQQATNQQAFFKCGMFGFEGSGKTFTATLLAKGLHQHIKSQKPIAFFDTETGSDYVLPMLKAVNIDLIVIKSRALKTLKEAIQEACTAADILIVDSLTHVYRELLAAYVRQKKDGTKFIRFQDWGPIKETWADCFSTPYVNSKLHFLWCSRAKNLYEDVEDVEASAQSGKEMFKIRQIGTAARAETESSYEPSILIEMTREMNSAGDGTYVRRATIIKDRFNVIDGKTFDNPTFQDFLPHVALLNLGGEHVGFREDTSNALFDGGDKDLAQLRYRRRVAWESIENSLSMLFPGGTGKDKQARFAILSELGGSTSETQLQQLPPDQLERINRTVNALGQKVMDGDLVPTNSLIDLKKMVRSLYEKVEEGEKPAAAFDTATSRELDLKLSQSS